MGQCHLAAMRTLRLRFADLSRHVPKKHLVHWGSASRTGTETVPSQLRLLQEAVFVASANVILLQVFARKLDRDSSPAPVWIRGRIVGQRIEMRQIVTDRGEGARFVLPALREVAFPPVALLMRSKTAVDSGSSFAS